MATGQSIITADGINALVQATVSGKQIQPKYFRFSEQDLILDPNLKAKDITAWKTQNINLYSVIDNNTLEFTCDIEPTAATKYTRSCGLYLEDNTLFLVAKPPFAFPPMLRQTFKIQMSYQNATGLVDFKYIPFSQTEQDLSLLNSIVTGGNQILKNCLKIEKIKIKGVK